MEQCILKYIKEKNIDYVDNSLYVCEDGLTFMFKDSRDSLHTGVIDICTGEMSLVS